MKKSLIPFLLVFAILALACFAPAMAQTPFRLSRVGAATLNYTNDLVVSSASSLVPAAIHVDGVGIYTVTVTHAVGSLTTNLVASKTLSATDRWIPFTNSVRMFKTDKLAVSGVATNSTWYLTGTEQ